MKDWLIRKILSSHTAKKVLKKQGKRILNYPFGEYKKIMDLIMHFNIDLILDVGANEGQYGSFMRSLGYRGKIISFEPLSEAYAKLKHVSSRDGDWDCLNLALGSKEGTGEINVSPNSQSSSLLEMNDVHSNAAPDSAYTHKETITIKTLDSLYSDYTTSAKNVFLKLDVQGYEKEVLEGASNSLQVIKGLQVEMSFEKLYAGEMLYNEVINYLKDKGFELCALKNGFHDVNTKKLLQADGIFFKV